MQQVRDLKPGDVVFVHIRNFAPRRGKVAKVGPKNLYIEGGKKPFDRDTGRIKDDYGDTHLKTIERHEYDERLGRARGRLSDFGIVFRLGTSDEKLLAIEAALAPLIDAEKGHG